MDDQKILWKVDNIEVENWNINIWMTNFSTPYGKESLWAGIINESFVF